MKHWLLGWWCLWAIAPAVANVVITGTRVIYPETAKDISVHMRNQGESPVLVQVWLDDYGGAAAASVASVIPFVVTPPVFRMEPNEGQNIRVLYTREPLPADRESLFQFNVLEVSPSPEGSQRNYLQLAFASKLKFFFRPALLKSGSSTEAAAQLDWSVSQARVLRVANPSPFHVSISSIRTAREGTLYGDGDADEGVMVKPYADALINIHKNFSVSPPTNHNQRRTLVFTYIDDFGVAKTQEALLLP